MVIPLKHSVASWFVTCAELYWLANEMSQYMNSGKTGRGRDEMGEIELHAQQTEMKKGGWERLVDYRHDGLSPPAHPRVTEGKAVLAAT